MRVVASQEHKSSDMAQFVQASMGSRTSRSLQILPWVWQTNRVEEETMTAEEAKEALLRAAENYVVVGSGAELLQAAVEYAEAVRGECVWKVIEHRAGSANLWECVAACGYKMCSTENPITDEDSQFCPKCGRKVRI